ncbi:MAG: DUF5647 family protein [Trueperaceae bacterium]|nr:DUF5647 family protein [Trueperaceae bacterium]
MHGRSRPTLPDGRGDVTQRNIWWTMLFTRLLMKNEELRREFPNGTDVILLPEGDDELFRHNLSLYRSRRTEQPVVLVNIAVHDSIVDIQPLNAKPRREYAIG